MQALDNDSLQEKIKTYTTQRLDTSVAPWKLFIEYKHLKR